MVQLRYGALDFDTVPLSAATTLVRRRPRRCFSPRRPLQIALTLMAGWHPASLVYAYLRPGRAGRPGRLSGCRSVVERSY